MTDPMTKPRDTSAMDELLLRGETDHRKINMPCSDEYIINNRHQRLHVRSSWPVNITSPFEAQGIVLSLHGYGSQANRPTHRYLAERCNGDNMAYITLDFAGHGYSEGMRGQVLSVDDVIDDALYLALAVFGEPSVVCSLKHQLLPHQRPAHCRQVPHIFFMGHSMGGGTAIAASYLLAHGDAAHLPRIFTPFYLYHRDFIQQKITPYFKGGIYICPVVRVNDISPWLVNSTLGFLADLAPYSVVPFHWGDNDDENHPSWASAKYRQYTHADGYPHNPDGLTYADGISLRTMHSILILSEYVQLVLSDIQFPFMLLHDPKDKIVPYSGSLLMMQKTVQVPPHQKTLLVTENMLHDILSNDAAHCTNKILGFIKAAMPKADK